MQAAAKNQIFKICSKVVEYNVGDHTNASLIYLI